MGGAVGGGWGDAGGYGVMGLMNVDMVCFFLLGVYFILF